MMVYKQRIIQNADIYVHVLHQLEIAQKPALLSPQMNTYAGLLSDVISACYHIHVVKKYTTILCRINL